MRMTSSLIATALPLLVGVKALLSTRVMWRYPLFRLMYSWHADSMVRLEKVVDSCSLCGYDAQDAERVLYHSYLCSIHKNHQHQQSTFIGAHSNVSFFQCITRVESWNESHTRTTYQAKLCLEPASTLFEIWEESLAQRRSLAWDVFGLIPYGSK